MNRGTLGVRVKTTSHKWEHLNWVLKDQDEFAGEEQQRKELKNTRETEKCRILMNSASILL